MVAGNKEKQVRHIGNQEICILDSKGKTDLGALSLEAPGCLCAVSIAVQTVGSHGSEYVAGSVSSAVGSMGLGHAAGRGRGDSKPGF